MDTIYIGRRSDVAVIRVLTKKDRKCLYEGEVQLEDFSRTIFGEVTDIETKKCIDEQKIRKEFIERICGKFKDDAVITTVLRNAMSDVLKEYEVG